MTTLHERVPLVEQAKREIAESFDRLYPAGTVIERACTDVCTVEAKCLFASEYAITPRGPLLSTSAAALWKAVQTVVAERGLTWGEAARIVHHLTDSWLHLIVRWERHGPNSEKKADVA